MHAPQDRADIITLPAVPSSLGAEAGNGVCHCTRASPPATCFTDDMVEVDGRCDDRCMERVVRVGAVVPDLSQQNVGGYFGRAGWSIVGP